jgi:adenylate kinase
LSAHTDIFIFLGPPGSGKGSLSSVCVKRLGWAQLSTGNLCRQHIADRTEIGKKIDFIIKSGKLISDSLIMEMVHEWLGAQRAPGTALIFDGLPRTVAQAEALDMLFKSFGSKIRLHVIQLLIPDESIIERLKARAICQNKGCQAVYSLHEHSPLKPAKEMVCNECSYALVKRPEDEEQVVQERLLIYHKHEQEIIEFYRRVGQKVHVLDVDVPLETVYKQLLFLIGYEPL